MGGLEFNKIFAAILVAGIIAMFGGFAAKILVHPHKLEQNAFNIEAAEESAGGGPVKADAPEPILAMMAAADVAKGEKIAKACAACHTFTKGGPNGVGPNLWGIVGGPKQHMSTYTYSGELLKHGGATWTYEEMGKFLYKPKIYAPGTKMSFPGLKKGEDRAALLAWLRTQSDAPKPLPSAAEIAAESADLTPKDAAPAPAAASADAAGKDAAKMADPKAVDAKVAPAKEGEKPAAKEEPKH